MVNHAARELHLKVVYYGPGLGGKTTNLEYIHAKTRPERRGKLISLTTESERTLFFDLLPMDLGKYRGYDVRIHLCTVPGQIALDETRKLVLRHVDGIVFVVDSQKGRLDQNVESIRNLYDNLRLQGDDPDRMPLVVQYNKRDLPDVHPVAELAEALGVPAEVVQIEASAVKGRGEEPAAAAKSAQRGQRRWTQHQSFCKGPGESVGKGAAGAADAEACAGGGAHRRRRRIHQLRVRGRGSAAGARRGGGGCGARGGARQEGAWGLVGDGVEGGELLDRAVVYQPRRV